MANKVLKRIQSEAQTVYKQAIGRKKPSMRFPIRSLQNVRYSPRKGHFEIRNRCKERTLTVGTVKTFAQTLRMMALSKQLIDADDIATKREAYYVSKNWAEARFREQAQMIEQEHRRCQHRVIQKITTTKTGRLWMCLGIVWHEPISKKTYRTYNGLGD